MPCYRCGNGLRMYRDEQRRLKWCARCYGVIKASRGDPSQLKF